MASSNEIYNQIQGLIGQVNPMLDKLPDAEKYYQDKVNRAYQYNLPVMQNAANIESKMYSMPGELMGQYNTEFGGKTGVDSNQRINSILNALGRQSGLASTAWGLVDQAKMRNEDLAKTLLGQYKTGIEAKQMKLSPLMSIWDRMYAEENANRRAANSGSQYHNPWEDAIIEDDETPETSTTNNNKISPSTQKMANSLKAGTFSQDYLQRRSTPTVPTANTKSPLFNQLVNNFRGIR